MDVPSRLSGPVVRQSQVELLGLGLDPVTAPQVVELVRTGLAGGRGARVMPVNLHVLRELVQDPGLRPRVLRERDLVVADGMPLVWAACLQGTPLPGRVAGSDLVPMLCAAAAQDHRSVYLLGGEPAAALGAEAVLRQRHPTLRIAGRESPPFGFERDPEAVRGIAERVRAAQPDIVFVAFGFPKQEHLIQSLRDQLPGAWFIGVGISLSFLAGAVVRAPAWMQRSGLEWLHRLVQEPGRLWRRYLREGIPFGLRLLWVAVLHRRRGRA